MFDVQADVQGDVVVLKLSGQINEDSNMDLIQIHDKKNMIVDFDGVDRINSYGIRLWVGALKDIQDKLEGLYFVNCQPAIVEQFNMISNFGGDGLVFSFYLPFFNEESGEERAILFKLNDGKIPDDVEGIPEQALESVEGGDGLEFNDLEDEYFYFLANQKQKLFPPEILEFLKAYK